MLPYTTYQIPESNKDQTDHSGKWLWMVVPDAISDDQRELLDKISAALKADMNTDVFLLNCAPGETVSLSDSAESQPSLVVSFGVWPEQLGLWIDIKKPGMIILESMAFILTLAPGELAKNATAKKELWHSMQSFLQTRPA